MNKKIILTAIIVISSLISFAQKKEMKFLKFYNDGKNKKAIRLINEGLNLDYIDEQGNSILTSVVNKSYSFLYNYYKATNEFVEKMFFDSYEANNKIIELLIDKGANLNIKDKMGNTPLSLTIKHNDYPNAGRLILAGADLNIQDNDGYTALIGAITAEKNQLEIAKLLIEKGADLNIQNNNGNTVLI